MKMLNKQLLKKSKVALALSAAMFGASMTGTAQAAPRLTTDGLGDAALFSYYTANQNWQTFVRLINTSPDTVVVKIRFREQANSREVLDYMVALSPNDMWAGWTDRRAAPSANATGAYNAADRKFWLPGIRTNDTSCLIPNPDGNTADGESFVTIDSGRHLVAAAFKNRAFTGIYDDKGTPHFIDPTSDMAPATRRLSEGHIEVIGVARYPSGSVISNAALHNHGTGKPYGCSLIQASFAGAANGNPGDMLNVITNSEDVGNVLAANAYLINLANGQGAGYDPTMIKDFQIVSLADEATEALSPGSGRKPDLNSADVTAPVIAGNIARTAGQAMAQYLTGNEDPQGVDVISTILMRTSVINEWAARPEGTGQFQNFAEWVVTFPTKNFYVDLQDDTNFTDDVSPTLTNPRDPVLGLGGMIDPNDAIGPFTEEFDSNDDGTYGTATKYGKSCSNFVMDLWDRDEAYNSYTSPGIYTETELCQETNVITFTKMFEEKGLRTANPVVIPHEKFPVMSI